MTAMGNPGMKHLAAYRTVQFLKREGCLVLVIRMAAKYSDWKGMREGGEYWIPILSDKANVVAMLVAAGRWSGAMRVKWEELWRAWPSICT